MGHFKTGSEQHALDPTDVQHAFVQNCVPAAIRKAVSLHTVEQGAVHYRKQILFSAASKTVVNVLIPLNGGPQCVLIINCRRSP